MAELKQAPFTTNMASNLPDPKTWAKDHEMSDQEQYEHDVAKGMPLNAYSRKEKEGDELLREAAKDEGIEVAEDSEEKKSMLDTAIDWLAANEVKGTPQASGKLPNPSEEKLISDDDKGTSKSASSGSTGKKTDDKKTTSASNNASSNNAASGNSMGKVRSIQQAYYDGLIDKGTRDYMMADVIAKFARNTGRDIGNIGAQFTGGTVNNNYEKPSWDKRNEELFKQQTSAEAAAISNSDKAREATSQNLANEKSGHALGASRLMQTYKNRASDLANKLRKRGDAKGAAIMEGVAGEYALLESGATSSVDMEEHISNIVASLGQAVASGVISKDDMKQEVGSLMEVPDLKDKVVDVMKKSASLATGGAVPFF